MIFRSIFHFFHLGDKCPTSRQIEKWRKRKGSNEDAHDRIRRRFRDKLFIEVKKATVRGVINGTTDMVCSRAFFLFSFLVIFHRAFFTLFFFWLRHVYSNLRGKLLTFSHSCIFTCDIMRNNWAYTIFFLKNFFFFQNQPVTLVFQN